MMTYRTNGYTLVEIVTALAVFTVIMLAMSQIMGRGMLSYKETKKTQANLETAQFALGLIAKELRTSSVVGSVVTGSSSTVTFYDYSQSRCIEYVLDESVGEITRRSTSIVSDDPDQNRSDCEAYVFSGASQVVFSGLLDQSVSITPSVAASPDPLVGKITFALTVGTASNASTLQTSISLRDYNYTGL